MPLEFGLSTSMLGCEALPERLSMLAAHGVPWIEIHGYARQEFDYEDRDLVRRTARALTQMELRLWSCHSPAGRPLDVAAVEEDLRAQSLELLRTSMRVAADLGAQVFVCDMVRRVSRDPAERIHRQGILADSLGDLLAGARRLSLRLVIENHPEWSLFATPGDFQELVGRYDLSGLGACWDTGHGWLAGLPPEQACELGAHLATLHLHDNNGRTDLHLPPTEGTMTWEPLVPGLKRVGYQGPLMMELAPPADISEQAIARQAARAVEVYRRLVGEDA